MSTSWGYIKFYWITHKREWRKYWSHTFSRYKLRGRFVTWIFAEGWGWIRVGGFILKWGRFT